MLAKKNLINLNFITSKISDDNKKVISKNNKKKLTPASQMILLEINKK